MNSSKNFRNNKLTENALNFFNDFDNKQFLKSKFNNSGDVNDENNKFISNECIVNNPNSFKIFIENVSDIITVINRYGQILYVSPSNQRITGYTSEDLSGRSVFELIHPADVITIKTIYEKYINVTGRTEAFEFRFKTKSGSFIHLEAIANNLLNVPDHGFIVINSWNITGRNKQLTELKKLSFVIEQNPVSIIITDTKARIKYINKKFTEQTGYTLEDVHDKNPNILQSDLNDPRIFDEMWSALIKGSSWKGQLCNKKKCGELYWEEIIISPIKDDAGNTIYYASAQRDITAKKKIREEISLRDRILTASNFAAHHLLKNTNWLDNMNLILGKLGESCDVDRVYIYKNLLNADGSLSCVNKFLWSKNPAELNSQILQKKNLNYSEKGFVQFRETLEDKLPFFGHKESFSDDLKNFLIDRKVKSLLIIPIFVNNDWWGFIGFDNCTIQREWTKTLSDALRVVAETIGTAFYRRNIEENLVEAKEKAEESNRLKTNFLSNISHELRTPMVGIIGFTEMLAEETRDTNTKAILDIIRNSAERLMETMNSIIDLSKLETARYDFQPEKINLVNSIKTVYESLKETAEKRGLELVLQLKDEELNAELDENLTHHVLCNLVRNAIKYTEKGSITLKAEHLNGTSNSINIHIIDTGIGIPDEAQKLIFEPFRQVSEGYSRKFEGVGLGLTITKKYIDLMGGKLSLVSEINKGSTFTVSFPSLKN